jgi:hypothetical protein
MGVFSGPKILGASNIVMSIDLANIKSYSGTGTSVVDPFSRNTNELSNRDNYYKIYDLEVGDYVLPYSSPAALPTYSAGNVVFDGTNNSLRFTSPSLGTTITVEIWARLGSSYSNNTMFAFESYGITTTNGYLGFSTSLNDLYGASVNDVTVTYPIANVWRHYIFEMRTDVSYSNNKIYIDGTQLSLTQQLGTEIAGNRRFSTYGSISSWINVDGSEMPMTLGSVKIYNRALTQTEILQNYSAGRGRFA